MFRLIYRQLLYDRYRTLLTALAIGAVISLMLILDGFQQGLYHQLGMTVKNRGADLILSQAGVSNLIASRSIIPQLTRLDVEEIDGVKNAYPLTAISAIYQKDDRKNPVYVFVYDVNGGPLSLVDGNFIDGPRGIIIDQALAKLYDLAPGDSFVLTDFEFTIAGISENTAAFFTPFAFIKFDDLIDFYLESDIAADITTFPLLSYLLVELDDNVDKRTVSRVIETSIPDVDVFLPEELAKNDVQLGHELFGPILNLLVLIAYIIGLLAISIIMFTTAHERKRSLAVVRALGFPVSKIAISVTIETAILVLIAFPVGMVIAQIITGLITWVAPVYLVLPLDPSTLLRTLSACIVLSFLGAFIAIYIISRIEPEIAFRS